MDYFSFVFSLPGSLLFCLLWRGWSHHLGYVSHETILFSLPHMTFPQDVPDTCIAALITTRVDVPPLQWTSSMLLDFSDLSGTGAFNMTGGRYHFQHCQTLNKPNWKFVEEEPIIVAKYALDSRYWGKQLGARRCVIYDDNKHLSPLDAAIILVKHWPIPLIFLEESIKRARKTTTVTQSKTHTKEVQKPPTLDLR